VPISCTARSTGYEDFIEYSELLTFEPKFHVQRLAWYRANESQFKEYTLRLELLSRSINVSVSALTCRDLMCRDADHFLS